MATIEVVIVTHRGDALRTCLDHVLVAGSRVFVVVDGRDDGISEVLASAARRYPSLRYFVSEKKIGKSRARNEGINRSQAEVLYFLDDDAYFAGGNLSRLAAVFEAHPDVAAAGGPNLTPEGSGAFQRFSGYALSSPFVAGAMHLRYRPGGAERECTDTSLALCNLAIRRDVLVTEGIYFDERLEYNEENLLLERLTRKGWRLRYCPDLVVYHERRNGILRFSRQVYESGRGRARMTLLLPRSLSFIHLMPSLFALYLIALVRFHPWWMLAPLGAYAAVMLAGALVTGVRHREPARCWPLFPLLAAAAHLSYGAGFAWGILSRPRKG